MISTYSVELAAFLTGRLARCKFKCDGHFCLNLQEHLIRAKPIRLAAYELASLALSLN